jgi:hypothetical protein
MISQDWVQFVDICFFRFQQQKQDMTADSVTKVEASLGRASVLFSMLVSGKIHKEPMTFNHQL